MEVYLISTSDRPLIKLDIFSKARIITLKKFHLDIDPKYNNLTIKFEDGYLKIEGRDSSKIGSYVITIKEQVADSIN